MVQPSASARSRQSRSWSSIDALDCKSVLYRAYIAQFIGCPLRVIAFGGGPGEEPDKLPECRIWFRGHAW
jgi:hypothetical protein